MGLPTESVSVSGETSVSILGNSLVKDDTDEPAESVTTITSAGPVVAWTGTIVVSGSTLGRVTGHFPAPSSTSKGIQLTPFGLALQDFSIAARACQFFQPSSVRNISTGPSHAAGNNNSTLDCSNGWYRTSDWPRVLPPTRR